ncbi:MAG: hypothetical protein KatS3mg105_2683 [Gemmatales bacterium]|nr:MAG: hypothetical protein KatS3mg105_2683 [Gemmatales bacterium]
MTVLTCFLFSLACCAEEGSVKVTVISILASEKEDHVDPRLKRIAAELRRAKELKKMTCFRLARSTAMSVEVGKSYKFRLVDDQWVNIKVDHGADANNKVSLTVKASKLGAISYTTCCGKFFPIVTPHVTKDQERLIFCIMVKPCR